MTAKWESTTLGALCAVNPESRGADWPHSVIQYIDISSVGSGFFSNPPREIPLGEEPSRAQRLVEAEDTIISTVRPNRRSYLFLNSPSPNTVVSTGFCVLRARKGKADPRFVYYLVTQQSFTDYLTSRAEGSAYPAVNPSVIEEAEIRVPPLSEQRKIAHILGALDDKIELNRQMNKTLEAIAQTLFQSWFIDFTPVHTKAKGRPTGLPPQISDLFPSKFEDSPLGPIPKGWEVVSLGKVTEVVMGQSPPGNTYNKEGVGFPFYQGVADFQERYPKKRVFCAAPTRFADHGDILLSVRAPIGRVNLAIERCAIGRGLASIRAANSEYHSFLEFAVRQNSENWRILESQGSVFGNATKSDLLNLPIVWPDRKTLLTISSILVALGDKMEHNFKMNYTLTGIRDSLLPKLLSGEVRIKAK